jgi:hypothetical protein
MRKGDETSGSAIKALGGVALGVNGLERMNRSTNKFSVCSFSASFPVPCFWKSL